MGNGRKLLFVCTWEVAKVSYLQNFASMAENFFPFVILAALWNNRFETTILIWLNPYSDFRHHTSREESSIFGVLSICCKCGQQLVSSVDLPVHSSFGFHRKLLRKLFCLPLTKSLFWFLRVNWSGTTIAGEYLLAAHKADYIWNLLLSDVCLLCKHRDDESIPPCQSKALAISAAKMW